MGTKVYLDAAISGFVRGSGIMEMTLPISERNDR
jgi:hypothetical protein